MPSSLSRPAKLFVALIVSVLLSYGALYLWKSFSKGAFTASGEMNQIATDRGEADNAQARMSERP
jgi:hypothetical protein